jgi:predicted enzyme related to lactoylglutathione lyase
MRIRLTTIMVDDQDKALRFYTEILGFKRKHDIPVGEYRWITVTSPAAGPVTIAVFADTCGNLIQLYQPA